MTKRRYDDGCAAAHALDLVGERWALLVVRELLLGPKRFGDLREGLPHISPNVLSQRLRDLEDAGVVRRFVLPPPASVPVYELSAWGRDLEPVLQHLGRWGARSPSLPRGAAISVATFITALKTMFSRQAAADVRATLELRLGAEQFRVHLEHGRFEVDRGSAPYPDAIVQGDHAALASVIFGGRPLSEALGAGEVRVIGDEALVGRFVRLFPLPEPVVSADTPFTAE